MLIQGQYDRWQVASLLTLLGTTSIDALDPMERLEVTLRALSALRAVEVTHALTLKERFRRLPETHHLVGVGPALQKYGEGISQESRVAVLYDALDHHLHLTNLTTTVLITTDHQLLLEQFVLEQGRSFRSLAAYQVSDLSQDDLRDLLRVEPNLAVALVRGVCELLKYEAQLLRERRDKVLEELEYARALGRRIQSV